ncbi:MAG TPA: hypothetical protein VF668_01140 [Pyrinomonadaceae bacterium]
MDEYSQIYFDAAEIARQQLHTGSTFELWGKDPEPPRAPKLLLAITVSWFCKFSSHELKEEATQQSTRRRTLDFYLGWRPELTEELINSISGVRLDGKRYALATEARAAVAAPYHLLLICWPTGEVDD